MIMKKMTKNLLTTIILILMLSINIPFVSSAEDDIGGDGDELIIECIRQGRYDFITFIEISVANESFVDLIGETWKDLFWRNACHALSVLSLLEQRNAIRAAIRDAALSCNAGQSVQSDCDDEKDNDGDGKIDWNGYTKNEGEDTGVKYLPDPECEGNKDYNEDIGEIPPSELEIRYKELNAEIYYVRNIIDGSFGLKLPFSVLSKFASSATASRDELYTEMKDKLYKKDFFTEDEFDALFLEFENSYGMGTTGSANCEDGEDNDNDGLVDESDSSCFSEIFDAQGKGTGETEYNPKLEESNCNFIDDDAINDIKCNFLVCKSGSWQEVADKLKEFEEGLQDILKAFEDIANQAEQLAESTKDLGKRFTSLEGFFGPLLAVKLNNQDFGDGFFQMIDDLSDDVDIFNSADRDDFLTMDSTSFLDGAILGNQTVSRKELKGEMIAKFQGRYESSFAGFQDVIDLMDINIKIIKESTAKISTLREESWALTLKQCKSS